MKTYYSVLGIEKTATLEEIKSAYRQLASRHHPDVNRSSDSTETFKLIHRAYSALADSDKRDEYDQIIENQGLFRKTDPNEVIESSGLWPALSNSLAFMLTFGGVSLFFNWFCQWVVEVDRIFWNASLIIASTLGLLFGTILAFNGNFDANEIFGGKILVYRVSFYLLIILIPILIIYLDAKLLLNAMADWF